MPVKACTRHGRAPCRACSRPRRQERRKYSGTAAERAMRAAVAETHGTDCSICNEPEDGPMVLHHHVIPHVDGGPFELWNMRLAHADCNASRGAR